MTTFFLVWLHDFMMVDKKMNIKYQPKRVDCLVKLKILNRNTSESFLKTHLSKSCVQISQVLYIGELLVLQLGLTASNLHFSWSFPTIQVSDANYFWTARVLLKITMILTIEKSYHRISNFVPTWSDQSWGSVYSFNWQTYERTEPHDRSL